VNITERREGQQLNFRTLAGLNLLLPICTSYTSRDSFTPWASVILVCCVLAG
jgi:hypothetical protein